MSGYGGSDISIFGRAFPYLDRNEWIWKFCNDAYFTLGGLMHLRAIAVSAFLVSCSMSMYGEETGPVSQALKVELRDKKTKVVDLKSLTTFEWDEVVLFAPYEPTEDVCRRLALSETDCRSTITVASIDDGEMVMVFRKSGRIVHVERHHRFHGDFEPRKKTQTISATSAIFAVSQNGQSSRGDAWLVLVPLASYPPPNPAVQGTLRDKAAQRP